MPSRKHPGSKSVGWALVQAARLHRARMGDKLGDLGLFAGQEGVLQALAVGPMTMGELAAILRVRPPTASKTVSRLSALGLVERRPEPGDARLVRVGLTHEGLAKAQAIDGLWDEVEDEMLKSLDPKDRKRLRKLLRKAAGSLAEAAGADLHDLKDEPDEPGEGPGDPSPVMAVVNVPA
jgi:DNA-binding MarR family transcriptional regulator